MSSVALNNLWAFISSLSLSKADMDWLEGKIVEYKGSKMLNEAGIKALETSFGTWATDEASYSTEDFKRDLDEMCAGEDFALEIREL